MKSLAKRVIRSSTCSKHNKESDMKTKKKKLNKSGFVETMNVGEDRERS